MSHKSPAFFWCSWIFGSASVTRMCEQATVRFLNSEILPPRGEDRVKVRREFFCCCCRFFFPLFAKWRLVTRWGFPLYRSPRDGVVICLEPLHKAVLWPFSCGSHFPIFNTCRRCLSGGGAHSRRIILFIAGALRKIFTPCVMKGGKSLWSFGMCVWVWWGVDWELSHYFNFTCTNYCNICTFMMLTLTLNVQICCQTIKITASCLAWKWARRWTMSFALKIQCVKLSTTQWSESRLQTLLMWMAVLWCPTWSQLTDYRVKKNHQNLNRDTVGNLACLRRWTPC